jgi:hypothetical protein
MQATHTLAFWLLFSAPIDTLWKVGEKHSDVNQRSEGGLL